MKVIFAFIGLAMTLISALAAIGIRVAAFGGLIGSVIVFCYSLFNGAGLLESVTQSGVFFSCALAAVLVCWCLTVALLFFGKVFLEAAKD